MLKKYFQGPILAAVLLMGCSTFNASMIQDKPYLDFFEETASRSLVGYRLPAGEDFSYWRTDRDTYFYKYTDGSGNHKAPFWTKGDFNNDGIEDWVYILFRTNKKKSDVIGFISADGNSFVKSVVSPATKFMAVSTEKLDINGNAIDALRIFELEGHGSGYVWDSNSNNFIRIGYD